MTNETPTKIELLTTITQLLNKRKVLAEILLKKARHELSHTLYQEGLVRRDGQVTMDVCTEQDNGTPKYNHDAIRKAEITNRLAGDKEFTHLVKSVHRRRRIISRLRYEEENLRAEINNLESMERLYYNADK